MAEASSSGLKTPSRRLTVRAGSKHTESLSAPQRLYRSERECEEDYELQRESLEKTKRKYYEACCVLESEEAALKRGEEELRKVNDRSAVVAFMIKQLLREQGLQDEGAAAELVLKPQNSSPETDLEILRAIREPIDHYFRDHSDINEYIEDKLYDIEKILTPGEGEDDGDEAAAADAPAGAAAPDDE